MSKKPKDNTVGPWAEMKLDALRRGLEYYTTRLKKQHWEKIYIDAFAGPGLSQVRASPKRHSSAPPEMGDLFADQQPEQEAVDEEIRFLKGSPRVALDIKNPFDKYIFVERDQKRLIELEEMASEYDDTRNIEIRSGDANKEILAILERGLSRSSRLAYVFLDPFGVQVPWSTIESLAATRAVEVMINFPLGMAINRMLPKAGSVPDGWGMTLDTFFGSLEWRDQSYGGDNNLFGESSKRADAGTRLLSWYQERLKAAFGFVSEAKLIKNTRGGHLYYLIWAGPREEGLVGANHIMTMKAPRAGKR